MKQEYIKPAVRLHQVSFKQMICNSLGTSKTPAVSSEPQLSKQSFFDDSYDATDDDGNGWGLK